MDAQGLSDADMQAFAAWTNLAGTTFLLPPRERSADDKARIFTPARGGHVVDADLIAALDSGHIAGATLDVFHIEPLPPDHPFWTHPKVTVTPHIASVTNARSSVPQIVDNIRRVRAAKPLLNRVDEGSRFAFTRLSLPGQVRA